MKSRRPTEWYSLLHTHALIAQIDRAMGDAQGAGLPDVITTLMECREFASRIQNTPALMLFRGVVSHKHLSLKHEYHHWVNVRAWRTRIGEKGTLEGYMGDPMLVCFSERHKDFAETIAYNDFIEVDGEMYHFTKRDKVTDKVICVVPYMNVRNAELIRRGEAVDSINPYERHAEPVKTTA
jgi:hypothetical protein